MKLVRRRSFSSDLASIGVQPTRQSLRDLIWESARGVNRHPARTLLTALGTILGVGAAVATIGLARSAQGSVSSAFNAQRATEVTFVDTSPLGGSSVLTEGEESSLRALKGVTAAGLMWDVDGGQPISVLRNDQFDPSGDNAVDLPIAVATPGALATMGATVSEGRLYDAGNEARHQMVGLLGEAAAKQLGISDLQGSPAVFVGSAAITIVGIIGQVDQQSQVLLGLIVPPFISADVSSATDEHRMIVDTAPGAAQVVGDEGPLVLSADDPMRIDAEVPPDPKLLRQSVEASISALLLVLSVVSASIGAVAIANTTLLSVLQRRPEIGLRRSLGAKPVHITTLILAEAAIIGTFGGVVGTSLGVVVTGAASLMKSWTPSLDLRVVFAAPLCGMAAGIVAGIYPSARATRITPVSALRQP